jgi:hypothetical protein
MLSASVFITNEVHDQLATQKITMPTDESRRRRCSRAKHFVGCSSTDTLSPRWAPSPCPERPSRSSRRWPLFVLAFLGRHARKSGEAPPAA